jgi:hypothetical protein
MKPSETYLRARARTERAIAEEASSPQSRRAHLELALRYTKAAEALYVSTGGLAQSNHPSIDELRPIIRPAELGPALRSAFPLPVSGAFSDLLRTIDET